LGFELLPETNLAEVRRWFAILTDDIARLTQGAPILADAQPQLALGPARLTVTLGISPEFLTKLGLEDRAPRNFSQLPKFKIDQLRSEYSGGDVLLHVSADDPIVLSHAVRALTRDSVTFASVKYAQQGFSNAQGVMPRGVRQRNLMGQVDGTANPEFGSEDFANTVWISDGPDWLIGGTMMVFRRIAMQLNTWDSLGRGEKEQVIGRDLAVGAPLGKTQELDFPDFSAVDENGLKVIPDFAHIRRAHAQTGTERIFRRPFNYEVGMAADGNPDVGLLWSAYQRDIETQFLPIQRRLDQFDLLNKWTTPIGSAVFAILPGVTEGQTLGEKLLVK
jgi:dye decolorizing peroxidase